MHPGRFSYLKNLKSIRIAIPLWPDNLTLNAKSRLALRVSGKVLSRFLICDEDYETFREAGIRDDDVNVARVCENL